MNSALKNYNHYLQQNIKIYNWQVNCIQQVNVQLQAQRKRIHAAAIGAVLSLERKTYKKKRYWISPLCANRKYVGFFAAILPILHLEHLGFYNYFRMSATKLEELLTMVGPLISRKQAIREPISAKERLCITLRFLASGDSMHSLHYAYLIGTSNVGTIIAETCKAIFTALEPKVLYSELTTNDWYRIAQDFEDKWDFPHTIGAIDGKHIMFECPDKTGSLYYNYKGYHSLIFLGVCDADYMFTLVDIGSYGRCSDGGVFKRSAFGKKFENFSMNVPPPSKISRKRMPLPYCLIGDQAFPLKPYLLSPYPKDIHYTRMKRIYNYRLSRARRMIENCFGILASRWRIFRRPFSTTDPTATEVIKAAVCLHNWLRRHDITKKPKILYVEPELIDREDGKFSIVEGKWRKIVENDTGLVNLKKLNTKDKVDYCTDMRDEFCEYFNYEGKVDFQDLCA